MATVTTISFELVGADGGPLRGEVRTAEGGRDRPAVVVCHGFKGFKDFCFFPHVAGRLARAGMTAVTFNFSGSGVGPDGESFSEPVRFSHATFSNDLRDIDIVVTHLRDGTLAHGVAHPTALGMLGHSRGGGTTLLYAGATPDLDAIVTWAAISTVHRWGEHELAAWRRAGSVDVVNKRTGLVLPLCTDILDDIDENSDILDIAAAAERVRCPWLIVHGDQDESVPVHEARYLHSLTGEGVSRMEIVPEGGHTFGVQHPWVGSAPPLDRAVDATVEWYVSYLL